MIRLKKPLNVDGRIYTTGTVRQFDPMLEARLLETGAAETVESEGSRVEGQGPREAELMGLTFAELLTLADAKKIVFGKAPKKKAEIVEAILAAEAEEAEKAQTDGQNGPDGQDGPKAEKTPETQGFGRGLTS